MSEDIIVRHCSPTLAGMKTGNMFSCPFADENKMRDNLKDDAVSRLLKERGYETKVPADHINQFWGRAE